MPRKVVGKSDNTYFTDNVEIYGDKAHVHKIPTTKYWYFRCRIDEEKRHLRQSLRTTDLDEAIGKAENLFMKVGGNVSKGTKYFGIVVEETAQEYIDREFERIPTDDRNGITNGRWSTVKTQVDSHFVPYLGAKTKMGALDHNSFYDYANWRRKITKSVTDTTIRNEHTTIGRFLKFALRKGYIIFPTEMVEYEEIRIREKPSRDTFEFDEYDWLTKYGLPTWAKMEPQRSHSNMIPEKRKQFVRDFILILANCGLRFGEAYKLKWGMVEIKDYDKKSKQTFVELDLPKAICKNRKSRKILCRGGQYFKRIKTYSNWVSPENYLFVNNSDGTPISKSEFCCLWHELMEVAESHELNLSIS